MVGHDRSTASVLHVGMAGYAPPSPYLGIFAATSRGQSRREFGLARNRPTGQAERTKVEQATDKASHETPRLVITFCFAGQLPVDAHRRGVQTLQRVTGPNVNGDIHRCLRG